MKIKREYKYRAVTIGVVIFCIVMVAFPEVTAQASKEAINLWLNSIVPTMLPFFFAANFMKELGISRKISPKTYPVAMAVLSGYPMGARIAGDYYRENVINKERLYHVLSYSMITGPAFIIGAVGMEFLGSYKLGVLVAAGHYLGAAMNSLFYKDKLGKKITFERDSIRLKTGYYNMLTDAIIDSFKSISIILAYIIIFMIITDLFQFSGLMTLTIALVPEPFIPLAEALLKGLIEMTVGSSSLMATNSGTVAEVVVAAFIISFGGLSVLGQSMSMLRGCDVNAGKILKIKFTHGIFAGIITFSIACFLL